MSAMEPIVYQYEPQPRPLLDEGATDVWLYLHNGVGPAKAIRMTAIADENGNGFMQPVGDWEDVTIVRRRERRVTTLTEFLLARIAEDEARATALGLEPGREWWPVVHRWIPEGNEEVKRFAARFHPSRVIADCEARRRIIDHADRMAKDAEDPELDLSPTERWFGTRGAKQLLAALALPYADHPDYREEWRV